MLLNLYLPERSRRDGAAAVSDEFQAALAASRKESTTPQGSVARAVWATQVSLINIKAIGS